MPYICFDKHQIKIGRLMEITISQSIQMMKALADSSRLLILNSLFEKPQYVEELAQRFNLSPSTVSFHLKKLESGGLVEKTKNQYYSEFRVNKKMLNQKLLDLTRFENVEKYVQEERIREYRDKVLKTFIKNGRVSKMPAQLKKRLIILSWFAAKFERERTYQEEEVSGIIQKHFDDYCVVRRDLVDFRFMTRKNQVYKLLKTDID
jgi:predicted transcriptional regulator